MNIFVTDSCPIQSARNLPDKHIVKMPLETCQMLSIIYSDWYYGVGNLQADGTISYSHGAFRNHPCTQGCCQPIHLAWLIHTALHYATSNRTLRQGTYLSRRHCQAAHLSCLLRRHFHKHTQGRRLYTCYARVSSTILGSHYHSIQVLPHQAG